MRFKLDQDVRDFNENPKRHFIDGIDIEGCRSVEFEVYIGLGGFVVENTRVIHV